MYLGAIIETPKPKKLKVATEIIYNLLYYINDLYSKVIIHSLY